MAQPQFMARIATERRVSEVTSLKRKKGRDLHGLYMLEGLRMVESALKAGVPLEDIYVTQSMLENRRLRVALTSSGADPIVVPENTMRKMSDTTTAPGVLAVAKMPEPTIACIACMSRTLVLDGIQDPGNVGTLIRTAAWFGVDCVVAGPGTADYYAPKTVRATMGGLWSMVLEKVDYLAGFVATVVRAGVDVRVADMHGESISDWRPSTNSMIVIGSEAHGVCEEVRSACSGVVSVPPQATGGSVESLNAAIAGGILMSHW